MQTSVRGSGTQRTLITTVVVLIIDQLSKYAVHRWVVMGDVHHIFPGLSLDYTTNSGIAFSMFGTGGLLLILFSSAMIVALLAFTVVSTRRAYDIPIGMLLGGAAGNLIDRIRTGAVTDFIHVPHWPTFNLADSAICIGITVIIVIELARESCSRRRTKTNTTTEVPESD